MPDNSAVQLAMSSSPAGVKLCTSVCLILVLLLQNTSAKPLLFSQNNSLNNSNPLGLNAQQGLVSSALKNRNYLRYFAKETEQFSKSRPIPDNTVAQYFSNDALGSGTLSFLSRLPVLHGLLVSAGCNICKILVTAIQQLFIAGKTQAEIVTAMTKLCITFHLQDKRVCADIVPEFKTEVLTVLDKLVLSSDEICGIALGPECGSPYNPFYEWNITLSDKHKPPVVPPTLPKTGSPTVRVLHLTDIHFDRLYKVGTNAVCGEPLCCREDDGKPAAGIPGAGKWGDYRKCDTPVWTLENLFQHLADKQNEFDYIVWTGDLPAHDVWKQTRSEQVSLLSFLSQLFDKYLPNKPVYPAIGNHESAPVNSFPPPFIKGNNSISWLYYPLANSWMKWLSPEAKATVQKGAFYTVSPFPGFRIVSLNTNYCNNQNWWLLLNVTDPAGQLKWLIDVLQAAEDKKEKVHILGHIPPGLSDCLKAWSWNYYKIVNRYESTIVAQFFGHTHFDHFEMFYDEVDFKRPVSVAYIAPSVTPFPELNLGYRIYDIDGNYTKSSWAVLDHVNYIMNLTEANLYNKPVWQLEYSVKAAYQMKSLFPSDWNDLIARMTKNSTLLQLVNKHYYKSRDDGSCDSDCKMKLLCELKSGRSHDPDLCTDVGITDARMFYSVMKRTTSC
ncbi:sphingomyelin phosphodiesterase-like [Gigantopelta aegis]|uniref:sphingomyelin phosphodiesterase-like n=1 Tax=Gigantopelta aegis TaxID=1735272 RepID=UPI001B88C47C|nr:sphingomyelin phosphodiesterase-like [Gigantopelta aegis]XP_041360845.1 sphingomyelin phosphodiesterase-like [Gigantopelta aegis]XP_041360846.1 sphingomyelin phosphodiesterase-like [Gigantopelta aegis]